MVTLKSDDALRGLGNNTNLYRRVLTKFVDSYASAAETLAAHVNAQEYEEAERLAHTIKGLSGSVGAPELAEKAMGIEQALHAGADAEACQPQLAQFAVTLEETITACRELLATL